MGRFGTLIKKYCGGRPKAAGGTGAAAAAGGAAAAEAADEKTAGAAKAPGAAKAAAGTELPGRKRGLRYGARWCRRRAMQRLGRIYGRSSALFEQILFSSLTRRIVILNLAALCALVAAIMYLNRFRDGLIEAKMESLRIQGRIIAGAIAASATVDPGMVYVQPESAPGRHDMVETWYFPIDSERVALILRRVISPAVTRAVIYDRDANILLDSRRLYSDGRIASYNLPPIAEEKAGLWRRLYEWGHHSVFGADSMPYAGSRNSPGQVKREVASAMLGNVMTAQSRNRQGELVVSVAVPIQRYHAVLGVLLLSTAGSDIDDIVRAERHSIFKIFSVIALVMLVLSLLLASTVATPLRRLSDAAQRVRFGTKSRVKIPDYSARRDEIGHLSVSIGQMTDALYARIEAIESFAADVSHELKNPLTSLRSAVEALPLAQAEEARQVLVDIIGHDVRRLDRLITDIAGASRLDAELAREEARPVNLEKLLGNLVRAAREVRKNRRQAVMDFTVEPLPGGRHYRVGGYELRLGQVISNLVENARSFVPEEGGRIQIHVKQRDSAVIITVEDNGPGIKAENIDRIFERFYTDRPGNEAFGQNSGLGLSISRQIVEAHNGSLTAENIFMPHDEQHCCGARFIITLPALPG